MLCVCVCARARARTCVRVWVHVCVCCVHLFVRAVFASVGLFFAFFNLFIVPSDDSEEEDGCDYNGSAFQPLKSLVVH